MILAAGEGTETGTVSMTHVLPELGGSQMTVSDRVSNIGHMMHGATVP